MISGNRQRQVDAVCNVQAGVLTLILNRAHDVAGIALGLELRGQLRIENHEGTRRQHVRDLALGRVHGGRHGEHVAREHQRLPIQLNRSETALTVHNLPLTGLLSLEQLAGELTESRIEGTRVERKLGANAQARCLRRREHHRLDVDLGSDEIREGLQLLVVLRDNLQGSQRLTHAQLVGLTQGVSSGDYGTNLVHGLDKRRVSHGLGNHGEVHQVHGFPTRQAAPDLL